MLKSLIASLILNVATTDALPPPTCSVSEPVWGSMAAVTKKYHGGLFLMYGPRFDRFMDYWNRNGEGLKADCAFIGIAHDSAGFALFVLGPKKVMMRYINQDAFAEWEMADVKDHPNDPKLVPITPVDDSSKETF